MCRYSNFYQELLDFFVQTFSILIYFGFSVCLLSEKGKKRNRNSMEQFNQKMSKAAVKGADHLAQKLEAAAKYRLAAASRVSAAQRVQQVNVSLAVRCLDAVEPRTEARAAQPKTSVSTTFSCISL
jgi:hypothetical protein